MPFSTSARIDALMVHVKTSTGEARVSAMAEVVAVLLEERAAMQEHCAAMMKTMSK